MLCLDFIYFFVKINENFKQTEEIQKKYQNFKLKKSKKAVRSFFLHLHNRSICYFLFNVLDSIGNFCDSLMLLDVCEPPNVYTQRHSICTNRWKILF